MTDYQYSELETSAEEQESIFACGVVRILELQSVFVKKDRLSFLERNPMLLLICFVFTIIPIKAYHNYMITTV